MLRKLDRIPVTANLEQVLKRVRVTESDDIDIVTSLFAQACDIANPKALYRESYVDGIDGARVTIDGCEFESDVVAMNLREIHRVFAYVCTCGTEVDDWSHDAAGGDFVVSMWLDMIKEMFVGNAIAYLRDHIKKLYGIRQLSAINPGSGDAENWPIQQQATLFQLIGDVQPEIGVTLTDTFLMTPVKSTSGLLFPSAREFQNCALCHREHCVNRGAAFDPELFEKAFQRAQK